MEKLILLLSLSFLFTFCSDDTCTLEDWEGTYVGTKNFNGVVETNYGFAIGSSNIGVVGQTSQNTITIDDQIFIFDNCSIVGGTVISTSLADTYEGGLDGNELNFTVSYATGGSCSWIAMRQ